MDYIPTHLFTPSPLSQVKGPAIFWPARKDAEPWLVTGEQDPMVVALSSGISGRCVRVADWRVVGHSVQGVQFEVDPSSRYKPAFVDEPVGGLILGASGLRISTIFESANGFSDLRDFPVHADASTAASDTDVGFTRWRAYIFEGIRRIDLLSFEVSRKGER